MTQAQTPASSSWTKQPPTATSLVWLAGAMVLVVLPQLGRLPLWTSGGFALLVGWRLLMELRAWPGAGRVIRMLLLGVSLVMVYLSYGTLLGRNPGAALLVLMGGFKLLETHTRRDFMIVVLMGYFLIITHFLFDQSIATGVYMGGAVLVLTAALIEVNRYRSNGWGVTGNLRLSGVLTLQALPLMIVLFVLFPRIQGPLWGLPADAHGGITGLSDTMTPGSISTLSRSAEIAFRAAFETDIPAPAERYWRGPVLWSFDGRTWSAGGATRLLYKPQMQRAGSPLSYTVTVEPHGKHWLFTLDRPFALHADEAVQYLFNRPGFITDVGLISADLRLVARNPVQQRQRYRVTSYPNAVLRGLPDQVRGFALQLPETLSPRIRELVRQWRATAPTDQALVASALGYFRNEPFRYTLEPPLLGQRPTEDFLFNTRAGFCEHFASAFTVLMRAAGVPARVVTGYQGGEYNPIGNYLAVRQSAAHAWSEVWLNGEGWVRIDPTAAVAPERIDRGSQVFGEEAGVAGASFDADTLTRLWEAFRLGADAVNNAWNQWILSYDPNNQQRLLAKLGLDSRSWRAMGMALGGLGTAIVVVYAVTMLRRSRPKPDPLSKAYQMFCRKLARRRLARRRNEGPRTYGRRVAALRPDLATTVTRICALYAQLRYGPQPSAQRLARLQQWVKAFHP